MAVLTVERISGGLAGGGRREVRRGWRMKRGKMKRGEMQPGETLRRARQCRALTDFKTWVRINAPWTGHGI